MPYCICTLIMFARTFNIKLLAISDNDLVIIINQHSRLKDWFRIKDRTTKLMKHNVAYGWFINWSDHWSRRALPRSTCWGAQQSSGELATIGKQCAESPTHAINYDNLQLLGFTDKFQLKYVESFLIQNLWSILSHCINGTESSVKLKLFNLPL